MSKILFLLATLAESSLSVFGIRAPYEQPHYTVTQTLAPGIELRAYAPRMAVETDIVAGDQGQAFGRLFRYITGANTGSHLVAMTIPVEQAAPQRIVMTLPVQSGGADSVMRFFLPAGVVRAGAPQPTEAGVRIAHLPATTLGVIAYSGTATDASRADHASRLRATLAASGHAAEGQPMYFSYDPPFSIPFLRRNEVAFQVTPVRPAPGSRSAG